MVGLAKLAFNFCVGCSVSAALSEVSMARLEGPPAGLPEKGLRRDLPRRNDAEPPRERQRCL